MVLPGIDSRFNDDYDAVVTPGCNWNPQFSDRYFSADNGLLERQLVFVQANRLTDRVVELANSRPLIIGELGFGSGLNLVALALALRNIALHKPPVIHWYSVDCQPLTTEHISQLLSGFDDLADVLPTFLRGYEALGLPQIVADSVGHGRVTFGWVTLELHILRGDVAGFPAVLPPMVDAWLLDGHDPAKNPAMWSESLFRQLRARSHDRTSLASWSAAGSVKRALRTAGFVVVRQPGFGQKRHRIVGHCQQLE
jgi:tRNA 5-methylaminomethyl-2-thiouridine biosynthesis bifunctional protein